MIVDWKALFFPNLDGLWVDTTAGIFNLECWKNHEQMLRKFNLNYLADLQRERNNRAKRCTNANLEVTLFSYVSPWQQKHITKVFHSTYVMGKQDKILR